MFDKIILWGSVYTQSDAQTSQTASVDPCARRYVYGGLGGDGNGDADRHGDGCGGPGFGG